MFYFIVCFIYKHSKLLKNFLAFERSKIGSHWKRTIFRDRFFGVKPICALETGVRRADLLLCCASRLHLSRLPRAHSFFFLRHGPTRWKGWFVDLTSRTVGASLTYRRGHRMSGASEVVDVPMQPTDPLLRTPIDAWRPTIDQHEFTMNLMQWENVQRDD